MRILAGKAKGRKILTLATKEARPTLQIVRKSIFDIIAEDVPGAHVLDLYAGPGSLGLEALSRGSQKVTFVDENRRVLDKLTENIERLGFHEKTQLVNEDVVKTLFRLSRGGKKYDIVFVDPPYKSNLVSGMIEALEVCDILRNRGSLIIEHSKHIELPHRIGWLTLWKMREFGETRVSFYRRQEELS